MLRIALALTAALASVFPQPQATDGIDWGACAQPAAAQFGARCATLAVPLDPAHPDGAHVDLALLEIPATGPSQGPVLADSEEVDGYGGSQIAFFLAHGQNYLQRLPATHRTHDIVLFDPRGLGGSGALPCPTPAHDPAVPEFPAGPAQLAALVGHDRAVCHPAHDGLTEQAADVEAIRAALGAPRLDWLGQATGGELGAVYAAAHPDRVGRMVLDTPVDPYRTPARRALDAAGAEEAEFGRFADWCAANPAECPLPGGAGAALDAAVAHGVSGLTADELRITTGTFLLGYPQAWPGLAQFLAAADTGDGSGFAAFLGMTFDDPDYTGSRAQVCADGPADPAAIPALAARVQAAAPHTGGRSVHWDALASCAGVPGRTLTLPAHVRTANRILVTGNTGDPIDPASWVTDLAGHLGARTIVSDVDGHGSLDNAPCAAAAIDAYLATGTPPGPACG